MGRSASSSGQDSTALGHDAASPGPGSIALGFAASSAAVNSIAQGTGASSTGARSIAIGNGTTSVGSSSVALGDDAFADGIRSIALGASAFTTGENSIAIGHLAISDGAGSTAVGIRATAPNPNTIVLGQISGERSASDYADVAIGTTLPLAPLHIFRSDDTREFLFLESEELGKTQDRAMMQLVNNGGIRFEFENPALDTAWRFQAATGAQDNFEVTKVGTGQIEFRVDAAGNATLAGMLFENSDRNAKTNIESIQPDEVLDKLAGLPISEWEYKDTPGQRHVGPMAQDFRDAFGLGANDTSLATIDTSGVALASIKALRERNLQLEARVAQLEQLVSQIAGLHGVKASDRLAMD